jgi:uncharacterized protein (TIGR03435 family)
MLDRMRSPLVTGLIALVTVAATSHASAQTSFEVASVRPSQHEVGPDYNNQITLTAAAFNGEHVTLKRLIAEAWHCQLNQVIGPAWLDHKEYDVETRLPEGSGREQIPLMLQNLLTDRFHLKQHSETRSMHVYELTTAAGGAKIHAVQPDSAPESGSGFHFRGTMVRFADLLAVQFSIPAASSPDAPVKAGGPPIPVLDKTGLPGIYDFSVDIRPEMGTDAFTGWKRALQEQLGLQIESRSDAVPVVVVDDASQIPAAN